jgi:protein-ribulosamine 3-kinase
MYNSFLQQLSHKNDLQVISVTPVSGGDINEAHCLFTDKGMLFIKMNNAARYPGMLSAEAKGLALLSSTHTLQIPEVVAEGELEGMQYLLLEWITTGRPMQDFWLSFGRKLASLHLHTQTQFGLDFENYIGSLPQSNLAYDDFATFYSEKRLHGLVKRLHDMRRIEDQVVLNFEKLFSRLPMLIPKEPPALLHGDLWAGNYLTGSNGEPVLIDPAPYYGHREMDIAMTHLFGGFEPNMLAAYQQVYPLEKGWEKRVPLFQLYPVLVHAVLFGGHYITKGVSIMRSFL